MIRRVESALMTMEKPSAFFEQLPLEDRALLAELYGLIGVPQSPKYHPEGDAFVHTMMVVDEAAAMRSRAKRPFPFMLAALTHDLGKKISTGQKEDGDWHSIGHERTGGPIISRMLSRLGADEETIAYCVNLCALHMRVHTCYFGNARVKATNRLFGECVCPQDLALLCMCDSFGKGTPRENAIKEAGFIEQRLKQYLESEKKQKMPS